MRKVRKDIAKKAGYCNFCTEPWETGDSIAIFDAPFEISCLECLELYREERKTGGSVEQRIKALENKIEEILKYINEKKALGVSLSDEEFSYMTGE